MNVRRVSRIAGAVLVLLVVCVTCAAVAQDRGQFAGRVLADLDGLPLADARLVLTPVGGGRAVRKKSSREGRYEFEVPPGRYVLTVEMPGFMRLEESLDVVPGELLGHDPRLKLGRMSWTMTVQPGRPDSLAARTTTERVDVAKRAAGKERVVAPALMTHVVPEYTRQHVRDGLSGDVVFAGIIDGSGHVTQLKVLETAHEALAVAALDAVGRWRFDPTRLNGVPVDATLIAFRFRFEP